MDATSCDTTPSELRGDRRACAEWRRLAPMLRACHQITEADRAALIVLCIEYSRYLEAKAKAYPRVITASRSGYKMPNPWLTIQRQALASCQKLWPELGLTPSSRTRVKTADGPLPGGDAFSEFDIDPPRTH
jgi:P27 family predicted phage terminase small subunit